MRTSTTLPGRFRQIQNNKRTGKFRRIGILFIFVLLLCPVWAQPRPEGLVKGVTFSYPLQGLTTNEVDRVLDGVQQLGATALRTWGVGSDTSMLLDSAQRHGLKVLLGLWLEHGRDGREGRGDMDYTAHTGRIEQQTERVLAQVAQFKDHPALLGWGLGNEVILNIGGEDQRIAYACYLEQLCQRVKAMDPHHPVLSVSAWTVAVPYWQTHCPGLDLYGINAYGPAAGALPQALQDLGVQKPWLVTEFGPAAEWDVPADDLGVPIMPNDEQQYDQMVSGWNRGVLGATSRGCRGGFLFNYGKGFDFVSLWMGMLVDEKRRPTWYATRYLFTGIPPEPGDVEALYMRVKPRAVLPGEPVHVQVVPKALVSSMDTCTFYASVVSGSPEARSRLDVLQAAPEEAGHFTLTAPLSSGTYRILGLLTDSDGRLHVCSSSLRVE